MNFNELKNGKIYLAVVSSPNSRSRKIFVQYNGDNNFLYYALDGTEMPVSYPDDFHAENETIEFYEMNLPEVVIHELNKEFQYGYPETGGKRKTHKKEVKKD